MHEYIPNSMCSKLLSSQSCFKTSQKIGLYTLHCIGATGAYEAVEKQAIHLDSYLSVLNKALEYLGRI